MAGETATFAIELDTKGQGGAESMAGALQRLKQAIKEDRAEVAGLQAALKQLQGGANVDIAAFKSLRDQLKAKQASLASSTEAFAKLGGSFGAAGDAAGAAGGDIGGLLAAVKGGAGPLGGLLEKVQGFSGAIQKLGAGKAIAIGAFAAIAVAAVALTAALIHATIELAAFALASSNAALAQRAVFDGMKLGAGGTSRLTATIDKLASSLPQPRKELEALAEQLAKTGLRGAELDAELKKVATQDAIKKFGSVRAGLLNLDVQIAKFHENLARIFSGVKIEGFLAALKDVLSVFDQTTSSGKALKAIVEGLLNPLFSGLAALAPVAKGFFQGLIIGALMLTVVVLKVKNALKEAFGGSLGGINLLKVGVYAGLGAFGALVAILGLVAVALALCAVGVLLFAAPFLLVGAVVAAVVIGIVEAVSWISDAFSSAIDYLSSLSLADIGSAMIDGLVSGISGAAGAVLGAITGAVGGAISAAKSLLGIASPSKVFAQLGGHTAAGFVEGVDGGAGKVEAAAGGLADAATSGAAKGAAGAPGGAAGGGKTVTIGELHIHTDAKTAEGIASEIRRAVAMALEDLAVGQGALGTEAA